MLRVACALVVSLLLTPALRAGDWPNWRGPDCNGVARAGDVPIEWSESRNIAWKLHLPGPTGSTPVVWGDRIFLTSSRNDDFVLLCVGSDGKPLWERLLAKAI